RGSESVLDQDGVSALRPQMRKLPGASVWKLRSCSMPTASQLMVKLALLGASFLLSAAMLIFPPWLRPDGFPWSLLTAALRKQEARDRRNQLLARHAEVGHWRLQAKRQVAIELLQGQLSLLQAAAWFERLDCQPADMPLRHLRGWRNTGEQYCRDVLEWA